MLRITIFVLSILFFGCKSEITEENLTNLNGYWEIKSVTFNNGNTKDYKGSTTLDYIKIDKLSGFRKKVQPKFNGTYDTSNDAEMFTISQKEGTFVFHYKTKLSLWTEELITLSKNEFSVKNEQEKIYKYQRYTPINITK
ncbi:hypothetical protein [uncultured Maribacter sp.]|uniref:hypothetical protein n=1 Tax=uncultured Maribacter sp. TaxID=431308 RepID=UPI002625DCB5|nr:hypothetical protein [uncultured Maribacter sp.]